MRPAVQALRYRRRENRFRRIKAGIKNTREECAVDAEQVVACGD